VTSKIRRNRFENPEGFEPHILSLSLQVPTHLTGTHSQVLYLPSACLPPSSVLICCGVSLGAAFSISLSFFGTLVAIFHTLSF
jgi:hypothetical protein